jgi:hypothetical protein
VIDEVDRVEAEIIRDSRRLGDARPLIVGLAQEGAEGTGGTDTGDIAEAPLGWRMSTGSDGIVREEGGREATEGR